jgi:hypothetical protein
MVPLPGLGCSVGDVKTHGQFKTKTWKIWRGMRDRCGKRPAYKNVTVCERWQVYQNFVEDMGKCPEGLTLDRIDPAGNYEPGNVRWASWSVQQWNKRKKAGTSSTFVGVSFHKKAGKWQAHIRQHGKRYWLGQFPTPEAAARAYDEASLRMFGARVNFPDEQKAA